MKRTAEISKCGLYRYRLDRSWAPERGQVCWIMLNPSTADAEVDDATIRRCIGFTERFGRGELVVVNLFGFRSTNPKQLWRATDPSGPENGNWIIKEICRADIVVAAWGALKRPLPEIVYDVSNAAQYFQKELQCLGATKHRDPRHPLYVRGDKELEPWDLVE